MDETSVEEVIMMWTTKQMVCQVMYFKKAMNLPRTQIKQRIIVNKSSTRVLDCRQIQVQSSWGKHRHLKTKRTKSALS